MPDHGHDLLFGSFLTPSAAAPDRVVDLAVLSERVGLDLVTVQDHPYQPAHLDAWTLLSFVAARTTTVRLAPNVANLPLRPPAVLARSVAALDLLSGGRVELGLGAGAFGAAIGAMGGPVRPPAQAVEALDEAIEVLRQVWDVDAGGSVRVDGRHHRVHGAKRGPAPAHDVGIWLGAYKPRMLALTGRRADGWLPSLAHLPPGGLAAGNAAIDEAAQQAGRSPRDVRRLLNIGGEFLPTSRGRLQGPPRQWVEELVDLALTDGVSAFILASDDPATLHRFAAEVAPAVRTAVAVERSGTAPPAAPSPAPSPTGRFSVVPTPDDGRRRSAERAWDESTRPTGPAPDPDAVYDAEQLAAGRHLVDVHDGLRAELAALQDLVEQVAAGVVDAGRARSQISTMTLRQNSWTLGAHCETYCRVVAIHHTIEDRSMFPGLRRADARLGPVVDRLQEEHLVVHDLLERVDRALVAFVAAPEGIGELRAAVDLLGDALLSHLAYEERELVEPLARLRLA